MISKTKIKKRARRKTSPVLVETIEEARKNDGWNAVAKLLSGSTKKYSSMNLSDIDKETKAGDTVVIVGKVLSKGDLTKKVRICALSASESAKMKIKEMKGELVSILEEIKKNKKAEGVRVLR
jgi:large subunit ribosomal protein L18e